MLTQMAEDKNCDAVFADDHTLLIDLDTQEDRNTFDKTFQILRIESLLDVRYSEEWKSRNGNTHIRVVLKKPITWEQRCLYQAMLGSDPVREALTWVRSMTSGVDPVVLFRPRRSNSDHLPKDPDDLPF